jgi:ribosome-associated toxin RatA of RatAB toxin-antitoxin module
VTTRQATDESPERVWEALLDCASFPAHLEEVSEVEVLRQDGDLRTTRWAVLLRGCELEWEEEDVLDPERRRIDFRQTDGDLAHYAGHWQVAADGGRTTVELHVEFDIGIPLMAEMLDPIAERALRDFARAVVDRVAGRTAGVAG